MSGEERLMLAFDLRESADVSAKLRLALSRYFQPALAEVTRLASVPPTAAELAKVKTQLITQAYMSRQTALGLASAIADAAVLEGDAARVNTDLDDLQRVTAADVQRVMRKYVLDAHKVTIDYRQEDLRAKVLELTGGRGADVIYDPVGGDAFNVSLRCVAPEGRLIPMGFASGAIPQIPANILLVKNVTVIGFYYGYYTGWGGRGEPTEKDAASLAKRRAMVAAAQAELMRWFTEDKLRATIAGTFDLADWIQGFKLIEERTVVGKAVLVP